MYFLHLIKNKLLSVVDWTVLKGKKDVKIKMVIVLLSLSRLRCIFQTCSNIDPELNQILWL